MNPNEWRLDAMKGCKAWAKRAHALYEKQMQPFMTERELNNSKAGSKEAKGWRMETGLGCGLACNRGSDPVRAWHDRAGAEVYPPATGRLGERKDSRWLGGAYGL